jgi:hypothetical protein
MERPELAPWTGIEVEVEGILDSHKDDWLNGTGPTVLILDAKVTQLNGKLITDYIQHVWIRFIGELEYHAAGTKVKFIARVYRYGRNEHALECARKVAVA